MQLFFGQQFITWYSIAVYNRLSTIGSLQCFVLEDRNPFYKQRERHY